MSRVVISGMEKKFMYKVATFILTHGRPYNQRTLGVLQDLGYTGKIYLVLDDQDETIQKYIDEYGADNIIIFDKNHYVSKTDTGLHRPVFKFAVYARNAIEDIARDCGLDYFLMLDDDITNIRFRYNDNGSLKTAYINGCFDSIMYSYIDYMDKADISCMSLGFGNMYMSGCSALETESSRQRICVEAFVRSVKHKIDWRLNMVEDLITSIDASMRGDVWFQFLPLQVEIQMSEGAVSGGNSDAYNSFGKYKMTFFPTIIYPSSNRPRYVKNHWVTTTSPDNAVPKIISSSYRKER